MKKYALTIDLKDSPELIAEYIRLHQQVWPEVQNTIIEAGIHMMEIYHAGTRLFMLIESDDKFSWENKKNLDDASHYVQEWEQLMNRFQQPLPDVAQGEKWLQMRSIFKLSV
jgi:L-rhamnose mutarotase